MMGKLLLQLSILVELTGLVLVTACVSESELVNDPIAASEARDAPEDGGQVVFADPELEVDDTDVADYTVDDHKSFDPSGIVIRFEFNRATLSLEGIKALDQIVAGMKKDPLALIDIRGHADKQGEETYNLGLSARRAATIRNYLVQRGIDAERLSSQPLGTSDPIDDANRVSAYKKNRRGDFTINYGPSSFGR